MVENFVNNLDTIGVMSVSCGKNHTIISTLSGHVYAWGEAKFGALGLGGVTDNQFSPQNVQVRNIENPAIVQVQAGMYHSMILDAFGKVFAFGSNE